MDNTLGSHGYPSMEFSTAIRRDYREHYEELYGKEIEINGFSEKHSVNKGMILINLLLPMQQAQWSYQRVVLSILLSCIGRSLVTNLYWQLTILKL